MQRNHPFYVVAPAYDSASAGNRVLYLLAQQLERLGYEAFISLNEDADPAPRALPRGCFVRYLDPATADRHFRAGLTPVTIYPEISPRLSPAGIRVFYLLNYTGLLGGPERIPDCDYVLAYATNIARRSARCDRIMYIPVSDPTYWAPDPTIVRNVISVYAGKYVDHHGQSIPGQLSDAIMITRQGPSAPSRDELRALLQKSICLHVFENTAVATEAALCGCPVVYHQNPYFLELIAEHEHGPDGFTTGHDTTSIALAGERVTRFRETYARAQANVISAIASFAREAQALARSKHYTIPF